MPLILDKGIELKGWWELCSLLSVIIANILKERLCRKRMGAQKQCYHGFGISHQLASGIMKLNFKWQMAA